MAYNNKIIWLQSFFRMNNVAVAETFRWFTGHFAETPGKEFGRGKAAKFTDFSSRIGAFLQ